MTAKYEVVSLDADGTLLTDGHALRKHVIAVR